MSRNSSSSSDTFIETSDVINSENVNINKEAYIVKFSTSVPGMSCVSDRSWSSHLLILKINVLKVLINNHNDTVSKILLGSKESIKLKAQIETDFRSCKEAFVELRWFLLIF